MLWLARLMLALWLDAGLLSHWHHVHQQAGPCGFGAHCLLAWYHGTKGATARQVLLSVLEASSWGAVPCTLEAQAGLLFSWSKLCFLCLMGLPSSSSSWVHKNGSRGSALQARSTCFHAAAQEQVTLLCCAVHVLRVHLRRVHACVRSQS